MRKAIEIRIRPHNDDSALLVVEMRGYSGNAEQLGELIDDEVVDSWGAAIAAADCFAKGYPVR